MFVLLLLVPQEKKRVLVPIRDTHSFLKADLIKGKMEGDVPKNNGVFGKTFKVAEILK